jgi:acyl-CoA synthetase (NDP forming)
MSLSHTRRFASLDPLLAPRSVAVVGASDDPRRIGGRPIAYMLSQGYVERFGGRILPVNPKRDRVQGLPAFPSVAALPETPEAAIVAVPPALATDAVDQLGSRGTRAVIVFTAGYAEVGDAAAEANLLAAARRHSMRLLGPNCLGLFNARIGYFPIFSSSFENGWPRPGRIGIASQSGAYGTHVFAVARDRGLGTPLCITTGNEADVTVADLIGWMVKEEETDVIAAYIEGVRDGEALCAALAAARGARKPVVVMKVGTSRIGAAAARSHTASLAGDDAVFDAVLREFGAQRARTTEEMLDIAALATRRVYPAGNTLGVITISGGAGVLISDAAERLDLPMPEMPEAAQAALKQLVPFAAPRNPVDCTAQAFNDMSLIGRFAESMVVDGGYKSVLGFFTQVGASPSIAPALRAQMKAVRERHPDRLYVLSVVAPPERIREYEEDGFTVFEDPTRAVVAIAAIGRFGDAFAAGLTVTRGRYPKIPLGQHAPNEAEAKRLLRPFGVACVPEQSCATVDEAVAAAAQLGWPVVLKLLSPDIPHKTEVGGVLLGVDDEAAVRNGFALLMENAREWAPDARIDGVLVAKQVTDAVEVAMGVHRDPVFGPVAMVGLGGVFVEVLRDVALHRCPVPAEVAERMIRSLRGAPLLLGARGRDPVDVSALAEMLARLSTFAVAAGPRLRAVDINPVLALPEGAFAADAVIEMEAG